MAACTCRAVTRIAPAACSALLALGAIRDRARVRCVHAAICRRGGGSKHRAALQPVLGGLSPRPRLRLRLVISNSGSACLLRIGARRPGPGMRRAPERQHKASVRTPGPLRGAAVGPAPKRLSMRVQCIAAAERLEAPGRCSGGAELRERWQAAGMQAVGGWQACSAGERLPVLCDSDVRATQACRRSPCVCACCSSTQSY